MTDPMKMKTNEMGALNASDCDGSGSDETRRGREQRGGVGRAREIGL